MSFRRQLMAGVGLLLVVGCQDTLAPDADAISSIDGPALHSRRYDPNIHARGHGTYLIESLDIEVKFRLSAKYEAEYEHAEGRFHQSLMFNGQLVSFNGVVTCLTIDRENGRLWVGGVITRNRSEHPGFTTEIHQPGKDVWFRVLDTGRRSHDADRSTFMGFEGAAGFITSAEYCEAKIWPGPPDDVENARTNPFQKGRLRVW